MKELLIKCVSLEEILISNKGRSGVQLSEDFQKEIALETDINGIDNLCISKCVLLESILEACNIESFSVDDREALELVVKIFSKIVNCTDECSLDNGCALAKKLTEIDNEGQLGAKFTLFYEETKKNLLEWLIG